MQGICNEKSRIEPPEDANLTQMLNRAATCPRDMERVWDACYQSLRNLSKRILRDGNGSSLSATGLVHEVFLKLKQPKEIIKDRQHFFALAFRAMRHVMIQRHRAKTAQKRQTPDLPNTHGLALNFLELEDALRKLEKIHPRLVKIVEARFYAGFSREEAAELLQISTATLDRDWIRAKTYLLMSLKSNESTKHKKI